MVRKKGKKILSVLLAFMLSLPMNTGLGKEGSKVMADTSTFEDLNQSEIVEAMGAGWNLGNQLEASNNGVPSETAWGLPTITNSIFKAVKKAGFNTVRIPVSYLSYIEEDSSAQYGYSINDAWMARVKEVIQMAINNDLYVITNMHGDGYNSVTGGWLLCNNTSAQSTIVNKYRACWQDIANNLNEFDEHLIFESMNEEFDGSNYTTYVSSYYDNIMTYNQAFVDTVRATGGNNAKRWLLVPGWNTNIDCTVDSYFNPPTESSLCTASGNRIMISVHFYDPYNFTDGTGQTTWPASNEWATETYIKGQFTKLKNRFTSSGYPVVIGEYGAAESSGSEYKDQTSRVNWTNLLCNCSKNNGCVPVWWDNGYGFSLFNRSGGTVASTNAQEIIDTIMGIYTQSSSIPPTGLSTETSTLVWTGTAVGSTDWGYNNYSINTNSDSDFDLEMVNDMVFRLKNLPEFIEDTECTITVTSTNSDASDYNRFEILDSAWQSLSGSYYNESTSVISATVSDTEIAGVLIAVGDNQNRTITRIEIDYETYMIKYIQTATESDGTWHCRFIKMLPKSELKSADYVRFTFVYGKEITRDVTKYYSSISDGTNIISAPDGYGFVIYTIKNIPSSMSVGDITFDAAVN